jgi:tetratricopeptide (TPR) repeat protein
MGSTADALVAFRASLDIRERLVVADSDNGIWLSNLGVSYLNVGRGLEATGDTEGALVAYRAACSVSGPLAEANPDHATCQLNIFLTHVYLGRVLVTTGDSDGALAEFRTAKGIIERLVVAEPTNAHYLWNLSIVHFGLGSVYEAQGNCLDATISCNKSLAILESLAAANPTNTNIKKEVALRNVVVANLCIAQKDIKTARLHADIARLTVARLNQKLPNSSEIFMLKKLVDGLILALRLSSLPARILFNITAVVLCIGAWKVVSFSVWLWPLRLLMGLMALLLILYQLLPRFKKSIFYKKRQMKFDAFAKSQMT